MSGAIASHRTALLAGAESCACADAIGMERRSAGAAAGELVLQRDELVLLLSKAHLRSRQHAADDRQTCNGRNGTRQPDNTSVRARTD